MKFRKTLFWLHLIAGTLAGLVIGVMALTGVAIAFEPQVLDHFRKDLQHLADVENAPAPLSLEHIVEAAEARRDSRATGLSVSSREAAIRVQFGRKDFDFIEPRTGEYLADPAAGWARFFQRVEVLHRYLGASGENRPFFRSITGAANLAFTFLALSGLYLWFPRRLSLQSLRPVIWFRKSLRGHARDWNLHHTFGFWALPIILVISVSGVVISYPWATATIYKLTGDELPPGGRFSPPALSVKSEEHKAALSLDALIAKARAQIPNAQSIALTLPKEQASESQERPAVRATILQEAANRPVGIAHLSLDPYTGEALHLSYFDDQPLASRIRGWLRFLHTGEAFGFVGQIIATIASLASLVLVYTGLALSFRRLWRFRRRKARAKPGLQEPQSVKIGKELYSK